jgi:hypothetical protein
LGYKTRRSPGCLCRALQIPPAWFLPLPGYRRCLYGRVSYPTPHHLPTGSAHHAARNLRNQPEIIVRTSGATTAAHYSPAPPSYSTGCCATPGTTHPIRPCQAAALRRRARPSFRKRIGPSSPPLPPPRLGSRWSATSQSQAGPRSPYRDHRGHPGLRSSGYYRHPRPGSAVAPEVGHPGDALRCARWPRVQSRRHPSG